ncbi:transposase [Fimbriiglobus ruber]|uniref:Mobile element protein n=1 Tax=Fimbriiglobus ruber TaxID=1908690 RepID=A0A225DMF0_9BACT|nr:transposase [Fimbriiglobus ruber]OWK37367.1 Mobile element protein [Fimbriiglobus ruber]
MAQAVLVLARWILDPEQLADNYETHRGLCYTRVLAFPSFVHLLWSCLTGPWKSARAGLVKARDEQTLGVSLKSFYDKLKNTPVDVSLGFFRDGVRRLRQLVPSDPPGCPASLRRHPCLIMDGKVIKHVQRRLKALRHDQQNACKLLGPRTLVAADRWSGQVVEVVADLDGEANDVKLTGPLLDRLRAAFRDHFLMIGDRAFGIFSVAHGIVARGGDFLVRLHGMTTYEPEASRSAVGSTDRFGRTVREEWGWIRRGKETSAARESLPVRRITVFRGNTRLVLITSLADRDTFPVGDLLDAYLARWDIEGLFQEVTDVFHLRNLFSTTPQGMLFQLTLCFLMCNVLQTVKQSIARHQTRDAKTISSEMLFRDVQEELIAAAKLLSADVIADLVPVFPTADALRAYLDGLLKGCWYDRWKKANYRPRDPSKPRREKPKRVRQKKKT